MEITDFLLGLLSGGVLIIISQIIGHYFSRKNLKAQQEHSERIVKTQLFNEDRKRALVSLYELLRKNYETFPKFMETIESFLDGSSSIFLPDKLRTELKKEVRDIDAYKWEKLEDIHGSPPDYPGDDDYEAWAEAFPEQALDAEIRNRLKGLKESMRRKIRKYASED